MRVFRFYYSPLRIFTIIVWKRTFSPRALHVWRRADGHERVPPFTKCTNYSRVTTAARGRMGGAGRGVQPPRGREGYTIECVPWMLTPEIQHGGGCAIARQRRGKNRRVSLWFERNQTVSSSGSSARSPRRSLLRQVKVFRRFLHEHWGCSTERDGLNEAVEWDDICSQSAGSADRAVMWQNTETDEREIKTMRHVLKSAVKTAHLSLKIRNVSRPSAEP